MIARKSIVAALIVCALLVTLAPPVSGATDDAYVIDMRVGDTFSYQPETNMESVISLLNEVDGVTWDDSTGTLGASFDDVHVNDLNRQIVLKAVWTAPEAPELTQTAFQGISFRTYGYLEVDGERDSEITVSVPVGTKAGDVIYAPSIRTADPGTVNNVVCNLSDNPYLKWDSADNSIIATSDITSGIDTDLTCVITITNSHTDIDSTLRDDIVTVTVNAHIGSGLVVTSPGSLESYVGSTDPEQNTYTVVTNQGGIDGTDVTLTVTPPMDAPEGFVTDNGDGTITFDPSRVTVDGTHEDFIITMAVTAIVNGVPVTEVFDLVYTVWAKQEFLTKPSFGNVRIDSLNGDDLNIVLSATINRAVDVTYVWGDGSSDSTPVESDGIYTANHHYPVVGIYTIVLSAVSENGSVANHYVKYDSGTGEYEVFDDDPSSMDGEDHFPWWVITLILALVLTIVYLFVLNHPVILALDAICYIATIILGVL